MNETNNIYTEAFETYKKMGLDPVPIPYKNDQPIKFREDTEWQIKAASGSYTREDFAAPCNIGILLGGTKNVTDIDLDSQEAVAVSGDIMENLMTKTGKTMMFGHPSKPRSHFVFYADQSLPSEKITDPSDLKCVIEYRCINQDSKRGHQTVFPPSLHCDSLTGQIEEIHLETDSAAEPVLADAATLHLRFRMIAATALLAKHFPVKSLRHDTILAVAGMFARGGMPVKKATEIIKLSYRHSAGYNRDQDKAVNDVKSVYKSFAKDSTDHLFGYPTLIEIMPKSVVDKVLDLLGIEKPDRGGDYLTDAGNGRRLVAKHIDEIRYCVDDGCWYVWDATRWRKDLEKRIREHSKGIATDMRHEASAMKPPATTGDGDQDKEALSEFKNQKREILKWANQSENADRVSKTIISAQSDARVICKRSGFDQRADLLNCKNGVVNLHTGKLLPHDRELMMSNLCPVEYDPNATHPVWEQSLAAFTRNHQDLRPFLKSIAGYSIQGDKTEERIFILYGIGNSGKGTFMDWLTNALGPDYACAMDANSVRKYNRDPSAPSGDLARLEGKRIVVVSEIEKGNRLNESYMKQASGNDGQVARGLWEHEREFRPTHQFWFQSNYRPGFDSTDSGNMRRYIEIPFDNDLKVDALVEFDGKLKIRMRQDQNFLKAVLAWCVQGCVEWYEHGLEIPDSVKTATAGLFSHNDFLSPFTSEMCVVERNEKVFVKDFWLTYERWCSDQGEQPAQGRTFNHMMEEHGFERKQASINRKNGKAWFGIRLKQHDELLAAAGNADAPEEVERPVASIRSLPIQARYKSVFNGGVKVA